MLNNLGRGLPRAVALLAAGVTVVVLTGCDVTSAQTVRSTPTPTPIISFTPTPQVALPPQVTSPLGAPPANCPKALPPHALNVSNFGSFTGQVTFHGGAPAWELGIGTDGILSVMGTPYPSTKIMWVVGPNTDQPVTLSGHDLSGGKPLWFDIYPPNQFGGDWYTTSAALDPASPNRGSADNSAGHWNIWGIGIIAPAASCYELDVTSSAGSWHTILAAGTVPLR